MSLRNKREGVVGMFDIFEWILIQIANLAKASEDWLYSQSDFVQGLIIYPSAILIITGLIWSFRSYVKYGHRR